MSAEGIAEGAAACFTGAAVIGLTNHIDCLKQRWQLHTRSTLPFGRFVQDILRAEGLWGGLWRHGLATNGLACSITVGTRLGLYPRLRDALAPPRSLEAGSSGASSGVASGLASGFAGGALGYVVAAPFFYASRVAHAEAGLVGADGRLATGARAGKPPSAGADASGLGMLRELHARAGLLGLWKGAEILVLRGAVMSATQLATYDTSKKWLIGRGAADGPAVHAAASVAASLVLTSAICPLDVVLTTYQAGPSVGRPYCSAWACAAALVHEGGPSALARGWTMLWARFLPSSFLTFIIYEQSRRALVGTYMD